MMSIWSTGCKFLSCLFIQNNFDQGFLSKFISYFDYCDQRIVRLLEHLFNFSSNLFTFFFFIYGRALEPGSVKSIQTFLL